MGDTPYDDLHADDTSVSENPLVGRLERELASLRAEKERAEDAKVLAIQQRNEMLLKLNLAEAERDDAIADATAVRELMNCYNLGGWTDSVSVMQRALKAEAERDAALKDAKRLDAIEKGLWFVEPQYQNLPASFAVGKHQHMGKGKTLRAAIDAAIAARKGEQ